MEITSQILSKSMSNPIDNNKKISFVICIKNEYNFEKALEYIKALSFPENYEIEVITVKYAPSITVGYNLAMKFSKSKYKVYVHEDVFITNRNFIPDVLNIFNHDSRVGLIGVIGTDKMPPSGIWWDGDNIYGCVYHSIKGYMEECKRTEPLDLYKEVQIIDGLLMVTQYDINWKEDLFNGWHFYDASQCLEFINRGYKVVVPKQPSPWCIHDCGIINLDSKYEKYKRVFIDNYSDAIFPLVSILIPTYNRTSFLEAALRSAIGQTYKNIEIIICDDSTDNRVSDMIKPFLSLDHRIKYYFNGGPLGKRGAENFSKCFKLAKGEYINFLNDDDIFYNTKIEKMMRYFLNYKDVVLVTSYRKLINENGDFLPDIKETKKRFDKDTIIDGKELGRMMIKEMNNFIGEPSTVLFKKNQITNLWKYGDAEYDVCGDICLWLKLLSKGKAVYISEPLSCFRIHESQKTHEVITIVNAAEEWPTIIKEAYNDGFLKNGEEYKETMKLFLAKKNSFLNFLDNHRDKNLYRNKVLECFNSAQALVSKGMVK